MRQTRKQLLEGGCRLRVRVGDLKIEGGMVGRGSGMVARGGRGEASADFSP